ncbi:complement factor H-related protein 5-like, partial [Cricetulus griseus]|uniref:complement factor H-related protein 5-like n=1 Tax=Cricetulus griseus TaxID=10029 RepID=UPI0007DA4C7C
KLWLADLLITRVTVPGKLNACVISEEIIKRNNITYRWIRNKKLYSQSGDFVEFTCKYGYKPTDPSPPFRVRCIEGHIDYPSCSKERSWFFG